MHRFRKILITTVIAIWSSLIIFHIIEIIKDKDNGGFIERVLFSGIAYLGCYNNTITSYVMTEEQVSKLFSENPKGVPQHWTYHSDAKNEPLYTVIRIDTKYGSCAGKLFCKLPTGEKCIYEIFLSYKEGWQNYVIPIFVEPSFFKNKPTKTRTRWLELSIL